MAKQPNDEDLFNNLRRRRLLQFCAVTMVACILALLVARGSSVYIFASGLLSFSIALWFAYKCYLSTASYILLGAKSFTLFLLSIAGAGLFDLAILGYPGLIVFAALLGGVGLFLTVLTVVTTQCVIVASLTITGVLIPNTPSISWEHLLFVVLILSLIGFSVFVLVQDIKRLSYILKQENIKVRESREEITKLAHTDMLTQLPNRGFGEELFQRLSVSCNDKNPLAVIFIDVDNFKPINDALGHAAGDELLKQLTTRLKNKLTDGQYVVRYGGDEFIILTAFSNKDKLATFAENLLHDCSTPFDIWDNEVMASASIGIACAPEHDTSFEQLCRKADIAMYKAKKDGRDTFCFYHPNFNLAIEEKFNLLQRMRPALKRGEFEVYFQPVVDLQSGRAMSVEALIRWPQPDGTMIGPDKFIPAAESSGLIKEIGTWVLLEACTFCANQRQNINVELCVSVNVSVVQFKSGDFCQIVSDALTQTGLPPKALELELTESLLIEDKALIQGKLNLLHQMGVSIAIDDFGTGYSNLGYLRNFHASKLKIDRSFVFTMTTSKNDASLVEAMIGLSNSLGLKTVAEGIEDQETLSKLIDMGCQFGQGYYFSKPIDMKSMQQLLTRDAFEDNVQM